MGLSKRVGVGQVRHSDTLGRGETASHPQSAITGLVDRLNLVDTVNGQQDDDIEDKQNQIDNINYRLEKFVVFSIDAGEFTNSDSDILLDGGEFTSGTLQPIDGGSFI